MAVAADESAAMTGQRLRVSGGTELSFVTAGDASQPAVLLLHGRPNSARMFRDVVPALAQAAYQIALRAPEQVLARRCH